MATFALVQKYVLDVDTDNYTIGGLLTTTAGKKINLTATATRGEKSLLEVRDELVVDLKDQMKVIQDEEDSEIEAMPGAQHTIIQDDINAWIAGGME